MLTTTALVKKDDTDKTCGSGSGVDDHTIKLPSLSESAVCAKVYTECHNWSAGLNAYKNDATETCGTKTDKMVRCARANGEEMMPIIKEPDSPIPSVENLNRAPIKEESPWETRDTELAGDTVMAMAYTKKTCEKTEPNMVKF